MTISRRFWLSMAALTASGTALAAEPWRNAAFAVALLRRDDESLDLQMAWAKAYRDKRHLALLFTQSGCPSCRILLTRYREDAAIAPLFEGAFDWIVFDLFGKRSIIDFDGTILPEHRIAARWRVRFAPTILFIPTVVSDTEARVPQRPAHQEEIARMQGLLAKDVFADMLIYVATEAWRSGKTFAEWHAQRHKNP